VKADQANAISFAKNMLLAVSIVTLGVIVPLNSLILAQPDEWLCLSCLLTVYAVSIAFIFLWLSLCQIILGDKLYTYSLNTFTVVALIFFLNAIQAVTIPKAWRTPYAILCVFFFLFLFWSFVRKGKQASYLFLMFALVLSLYESVNLVRIVSRDIALSSLGPRSVEAPPQKRPGANLPHVFVLVFDELSLAAVIKDELFDRDIIPNLTRFSGSATWYRKAVTPYAFTSYAIPALLTGRKGAGTFRHAFFEQTANHHLFRVAAATHDVYISGYYLPYCAAFRAYASGCRSLAEGFSGYINLFRQWWERATPGEIRHTGLARSVEDMIAGHSDPSRAFTEGLQLGQDFSRPTFTYIHLRLPHEPYMFRANGDIRWGVSEFNFERFTQEGLLKIRDVYREQVTYTDKLFGGFLARLKELGVYDRSVIVVTSDHGISFDRAHPGRSQEMIDVEGVARVPLLVKMPGQQAGRIDDRRILNIELYQIVLNVLGQSRQTSAGISMRD